MSATTMDATTAEEVRDAVQTARQDDTPVEVRSGGTIVDRLPTTGAPVLSVASLHGVVAHAAEDLTITVRAGTPVTELAQVLAASGQECPIEPVEGAGSTVGGRIATALAGPRQLGAGRVRDWLLRVRFVTGAGQIATAGGVTVKDVTGYDLCRLVTGSWGTIGVITEVTLKLRPLARHRAWYVTDRPRHDLDALLYRPVALFTTRERTHVLLEGHPDDAAEQAALAELRPGNAPALPTTARASVDPARLASLVDGLDAAEVRWTAQDGVGVVYLDADTDAITEARRQVERLGGTLLVLDPELGLPAFGGRTMEPMAEQVRATLDPDGVLAPWRWSR